MKWPTLPKLVNLSLVVLGGALAVFLLIFFTLGAALDDANLDVVRLKKEIDQTQKALTQSRADYEYIEKNGQHFDALLAGDKLVPHTRRTAVRQIQALALEMGLSSLKYSFGAAAPSQSPEATKSQPQGGTYRVNVEGISLELGAPLDQNIYSFLAAVHDDFPGSMIMSNFLIERDPMVTETALNMVSRGQDSGLVKVKLGYLWKTAQQNQDEKAAAK